MCTYTCPDYHESIDELGLEAKAHKNITLILASAFIVDNINHAQCNFLCCPT